MWLPYLERLNKPYVVITRNPATVGEIATHDQEADPGAAHRQEDVGPPRLDGGAVDEGRVLRPGQRRQLHLPAVSDDPRLAEPRRLRQAGQLPPPARDLQQAVRLRAAGRRPLRRARHRGATRPVRDRRSAADRVDQGPRRAAAARHPTHRPLRADLEGRSAEHQLQLVAERSGHHQGDAGAGIDRGVPAPPGQLQRPYGRRPDQGHPRAAGRGPDGERATARVGQEGGEGVGRRRPASTPPTP